MRRTMAGSTVYAYPQRSCADETNPPLNQAGKGYYRVSLFWNVRVCTKYCPGVKLFFFPPGSFHLAPDAFLLHDPTSERKGTRTNKYTKAHRFDHQLRENGPKYGALLTQKEKSIKKK